MKTLSSTDLRANLSAVMDRVNDDREPVIVHRAKRAVGWVPTRHCEPEVGVPHNHSRRIGGLKPTLYLGQTLLQLLRNPHLDQRLPGDPKMGGAFVQPLHHPGREIDVDPFAFWFGRRTLVQSIMSLISSPASKAASKSSAVIVRQPFEADT